MKRIIVPTDFSGNAENALKYAINIGNYFESEIYLMHTFEVPSTTGMLISVRDFIIKDAEEQLANLVKKYESRLLHRTSFKTVTLEGSMVREINRSAKNINADLIVMGTQGASGLKSVFMGSNATGVINKSEVPVLAIPSGFPYRPMKEITFAVDTEVLTNSEVVEPLNAIANIYDAHISILHVNKVKEVAGIDAGVDVFLKDVNHSYHLVQNKEINRGIDRFVVSSNADLLVMVHRDRGFIGNLFHKSVTDKEAFDSPVPLLVLHDVH